MFVFLVGALGPLPIVQADELVLPAPGLRIGLSPAYQPSLLVGMQINPKDPFQLNFVFDPGQESLTAPFKRKQYQQMAEYFLASLTLPNRDMWVNLSPYEKNRIIPDNFGQTLMGRDALSEDYLLKQITSSLIYPQASIGKKFWSEIYKKARDRFGTTNIPVNTFNKVWIVPDKAQVYEKGQMVFIISSHLKVMLEEDYLALKKNAAPKVYSLGSEVVRQVVLPALEREVNEGKNFAVLRQIYSAMLMATWYKKTLKQSILGRAYADRSKLEGIKLQDNQDKQKIYQAYLNAFKKGVFNFVQDDVDLLSHEAIPRKYFAGGIKSYDETMIHTAGSRDVVDFAQRASTAHWDTAVVSLVDRVLNTQVLPTKKNRQRLAGRIPFLYKSSKDFDPKNPELGLLPLTMKRTRMRFVPRAKLSTVELTRQRIGFEYGYRLPKDMTVRETLALIDNMRKEFNFDDEEKIILPQMAQRFKQLAQILTKRDPRSHVVSLVEALENLAEIFDAESMNAVTPDAEEQELMEWLELKGAIDEIDHERMVEALVEKAVQGTLIETEATAYWHGENEFRDALQTEEKNASKSFHAIDIDAMKSRIREHSHNPQQASQIQIDIIEEVLSKIRPLPGWAYEEAFQGIKEVSPSLKSLTNHANCMAKSALTALYFKELGFKFWGVDVYATKGLYNVYEGDLNLPRFKSLLSQENPMNDIMRQKLDPKITLDKVTSQDLAKVLNEVIKMYDLYQKINVDQYSHDLDLDVQAILRRVQDKDPSLEDEDYVTLNRALLEVIYPGALRKRPATIPEEHVLLLVQLADGRYFLTEPSWISSRSHLISLLLDGADIPQEGIVLALTEKQDVFFRSIHIDQWRPMLTAMFYTALGIALKETGDIQGAISSHRKAIAVDPNYSSAYTNLGIALLSAHDHERAVLAHRRAIALNPYNAPAWCNLAVVLSSMGDTTGAINAYKEALRLAPHNLIYSKNMNFLINEVKEIAEYINETNKNSLNAIAWGKLANSLWDIGFEKGAIAAQQEYEKVIALKPSAALYRDLGDLFYNWKRYKKAEAAYRESLIFDPLNAETLRNLGNALFRMHDIQGMQNYYRLAIEIDPGYFDKDTILIDLMMLMPTAQEAFDTVESMGINSSDFHNNFGLALANRVEKKEYHSWDPVLSKRLAVKEYRKAIQIRPSAVLYLNLGHAFYNLKSYRFAVTSYQQSLNMDPNNVGTLTSLANALFQLGEVEAGQELYRNAIALNPQNRTLYDNLIDGVMLMPTAKIAMDTIDSLNVTNSRFYNNLGYRFAMRYEFRENHSWDPVLCRQLAIDAYTKAFTIDPDNGGARSNLKIFKDEAIPRVESKYGGIDFNEDLLDMHIKRDAHGMPLVFSLQDQAMLNIGGLAPYIVKILPFNPSLIYS